MKKKIQKKKKVKQIRETPVKVETLLESVERESKLIGRGRGMKREITRGAFKVWLTIPKTFLAMPQQLREKMGITDPDVIELMEITSISDFSKRCFVHENTLHEWKNEFIEGNGFDDTKKFFKKLTQNMLGALYREGLVAGDAQRIKLFLQVVEDWSEQMGVRHSGNVETHLDPEEKAQLDKLLALNTK